MCPVWVGRLLSSPLRKLSQHPDKILRPYVKVGLKVLDIGCAMGFFSLPMARMVGPGGQVICLDAQEGMIHKLQERAAKAGLQERVTARLCPRDTLDITDLAGQIDFALAFAVVHEVPDAAALFSEIHTAMKASGTFLLAEPLGRVSLEDFERTVALACEAGFTVSGHPTIRRSHCVLLKKGDPVPDHPRGGI
jgi:2-polyprenyl-3-methyl-5-hydroxy-6-metoxy-1,4-benzoquinol methylase